MQILYLYQVSVAKHFSEIMNYLSKKKDINVNK